jgi:hypothetical protein
MKHLINPAEGDGAMPRFLSNSECIIYEAPKQSGDGAMPSTHTIYYQVIVFILLANATFRIT